jgi:hypothetical protein
VKWMPSLFKQEGVTLLEVMFAVGILVVGTFVTIKGIDSMQDMTTKTRVMSSTDRQIALIIENIRTSLALYQINYTFDSTSRANALQDMPMEWSSGIERPVTPACKNNNVCLPGRYGFVVQPIEAYRGLYEVTLRLTHTEWTEKFREYKFLVTVQ